MSWELPLRAFWSGVRAEFPLLLGVFPFGMIYGILALEAGLSPAAAQAMSSIVFAGSAQFITTQLVAGGAPGFVIVLTILVVNLRHALYSISIAPFTRHLKTTWKGGLAYLLTDEAFVVSILNYQALDSHAEDEQTGEKGSPGRFAQGHWFFLGAGLALWFTWQVSTAAGVFLGAAVPQEWPLDFTLPLTFIALVMPVLKDRPAVTAALSAGGVALLAYGLPYKLGLVLAALVGIVVGMLLEGRR